MARQADPDLTYRQLQAKFNVSSSIVADAIKGGAARWASMLKGEISSGRSLKAARILRGKKDAVIGLDFQGKYMALIAEPQAGRGDPAPFRYRRVGEKEWYIVDAPGIDGMLAILDTQGWDLVHIARTGLGHGAAPFDGAYECIFKQK
ncbi:MAG TPA: hypothetical protein VKM55_07165 [Candidatus Lokiarchaeia archaeon]|nr:hypothetical protein [Candidatus Lokiarchaeia archaeon]